MRNLKNFFALPLITLLCALSIAGQASAPHTVMEFYDRLPARYIAPLAKIKNRNQLIEIKDIAHGYLRLAPTLATLDWEGWAEMALFKKRDGGGGYLIGVVDGSCATMCTSDVKFLDYRNGVWTDVTKQVLPNVTSAMILARYRQLSPKDAAEYNEQDPPYTNYKLPRQGTTLILNVNAGGADDNTAIFSFLWNGERFESKD